jgi:two-component system, sensor histidine kinase
MRLGVGADGRTSKSFDIRGEQVSLVVRQLPLVFLANVINPLLTAGILAAAVPVLEVAVWSGLLVALTGIRLLQFKGHENERRYSDDPGHWVLRLTVASGVSGCLWGIGLALLLPDPPLYRLFVAFVLGGMAAGSVVTLSPLLPVVTAFLLPCMLPLTIRLALEGSPVWLGMSALTLLFTCGLWAAAWKLNGWISTMLHLKMEKSQLADELSSVLADLERKVEQRTADLRLARDEANRANQMKTRFLAAASHDLGQPFQAMRLFIDLLDKRLRGSPYYEYLQALDQAHLSGQRMLTSLLDLSRLESGTVQLRVEAFPAGDLLDRLETEFRPLAESRGLRLRIRGCDSDIVSDPVLLHQIAANLLGNALRYTTSGGILLACRRHGTMVRLEVWDTGIGIAAEKIEEIFEEFHRIDTAEESGFHGVGLGLSIVRRTADLLNHKVSVCSRIGRGSLFSITVPGHQLSSHSPPGAEVPPEPLPAESAHPATRDDPL